MSTVVVPARVQRVAISLLIIANRYNYEHGGCTSTCPESCYISSEPIANCSSSASVDRLFVSADVSTDAEEDQGQFKVWHKIELRKFR